MVECTCFCYVFYDGKFYFVVTDTAKGNHKVPVVQVNENVGDPEGMLVSEIKRFGLLADRNRLVRFEENTANKTATFFMKSVVETEVVKGMSVSSVEDLFNNICRDQFKSFILLLSKMKRSGEFVNTEIEFFRKMEELRSPVKGPV